MLTYSQAEFEADYNRRHNIKVYKRKPKYNTYEFSDITNTIIIVATFIMMIILTILLFS